MPPKTQSFPFEGFDPALMDLPILRTFPQLSDEQLKAATEAGERQGRLTAAPYVGQFDAEAMARKFEEESRQKEQTEQEEKKRKRFSMLVDYFRPKSTEERMAEADARNRAQDEREQQKMAMDRELIAQGAAMDFQNKMASYRQPSVPPLVELGKDYFGRSIMTNRPASTVQEQARRVQQFNLAPGSLTQFATGGFPSQAVRSSEGEVTAGVSPQAVAAGQEALASESASQMIQESLQRGQQIAQAAEGGWTYDRALGRYVKSKIPSRSSLPTPQAGITLPTGRGFDFNTGKRNLR